MLMDLNSHSVNFQPAGGKKRPLLVFGISVLAALLTLGGLLFLIGKSSLDSEREKALGGNPYGGRISRLAESNKAYREAKAARQRGEYLRSIQQYEVAFQTVDSPEERAQIEYEIGVVQNFMRNPVEAIRQLKKVANNEEYPPLLRAYAVQQMGEFFYWRNDQATFNEIFSDDPYRSMLVPGRSKASMKNLFVYASSFYPLAYAELKIAEFYASEILNAKFLGVSTNPEGLTISQMRKIVLEKMASAERDVENVRSVYPTDPRIVSAKQRKAVIAGLLYGAGDTSLGDPSVLYEDAYRSALVQGLLNQAAFTLYNFAVFLARSGGANEEARIQELLTNFYATDKFRQGTSIFDFFTESRFVTDANHDDLLLLASLDPRFKDLLVSLGWEF